MWMRMLILHVDYFSCSLTEKGRSKLIEEPSSRTTEVGESLLVLASVEKQDEAEPENVSKKTEEEVTKLARQLKVNTIILHPFAHLFGELSEPEVAVKILKLTEKGLLEQGFNVVRTPFGWFNTLELRAKGHPLSRVARQITAN
jgi:threonyl-tRNA synthetase